MRQLATDLWNSPGRLLILLAGCVFAAYPQVVLGLHSFFYRDYGVLAYPFVFHARESFWQGELPLWNPLSNCGSPFLAQWGTMVLYPFSVIYLLLPLPWSLSVFCLGHLILGGMGMYVLANRWVEHRYAAAFAAVAFIFNGATLSALAWPNYTVALGWMPWVVMAAEKAWKGSAKHVVLASVVGALQMLSGVPELILLTWLFIAGFAIYMAASGQTTAARASGVTAAIVLLVAGLCAAQLLPFYDLLAHSHRDQTFSSTKWAMPGWGWANLLLPLFHAFETPTGQFFQDGQAFMGSYYLGGATLILAIWGLWRIRSGKAWLLGAGAMLSLILALGNQGFVFQWVREGFPWIKIARFPVKFVYLAVFCIPILAAYGVRDLLVQRAFRSVYVLALGSLVLTAGLLLFAWAYPFPFDQWNVTAVNGLWRVALLLGTLAGLRVLHPQYERWVRLGVLLLLVFDGMSHTPSQNPTIPAGYLRSSLWRQEHRLEAGARVMISRTAEEHLLHNGITNHVDDFVGKRLALWSNLNILEGVPKVNGSSTLQLRDQRRFESWLYNPTNVWTEGLCDFLSVAYMTSPRSAVEWIARTNRCSMITFGPQALFANPEQTLHALANPSYDPRKRIYLPLEAARTVSATNRGRSELLWHKQTTHSIQAEVTSDVPALMVIAQSYHHCWKPSVDGQPVKLWKANGAFQAFEVPAGQHQILVEYRDNSFRLGVWISLLTAGGCVMAAFRPRSWAFARSRLPEQAVSPEGGALKPA